MNIYDMLFKIFKIFIKDEIPNDILYEIIKTTYSIDIPVKNLNNNHILELFHGPSKSFKDFGAILSAKITKYFLNKNNSKRIAIVATSGDTGSAAAYAYSNENIPIINLFPNNRISQYQKNQIIKTKSDFVNPISVEGDFDDCQKSMKQFISNYPNKFLTANSVNIIRIIAQIGFYFIAALKLNFKEIDVIVPSGNLGNSLSCIIAKKMGLKFRKIIIATNKNDIVDKFFKTGKIEEKKQ